MTSNQIAYASQQEAARHNEAMEVETNRHNVETERLSSEANDIAKEKNIITQTYQYNMLEVQKEYNSWYERYMNASTKKKLELEEQGNLIKQKQNDITESYNIRMAELKSIEAGINKQAADEVKRHNTAMELNAMALASMDWWFRDLEIKEKQRANTIQDSYYAGSLENVRRGQDLTFDASVLSTLGKSGLDLSVPGFKIGIKGLGPLTTTELFSSIIGDRYGSKEQIPENKGTEGTQGSRKSVFTGPNIQPLGPSEGGEGRAIPGRLR